LELGLTAQRWTFVPLHGERAAAATGALGTGIADAETSAVQVVVEIDREVAEVHQAALVHHHLAPGKVNSLSSLSLTVVSRSSLCWKPLQPPPTTRMRR